MKHPNMSDTLIACCGSIGYMLPYMRGEYAPHYPVPTTIENAETSGNWLTLSLCPEIDGPCEVCIDKYIDQLVYDNPALEEYMYSKGLG